MCTSGRTKEWAEENNQRNQLDKRSTHISGLDDIKTGVSSVLREERGGNLLIGHAVSGVQEA